MGRRRVETTLGENTYTRRLDDLGVHAGQYDPEQRIEDRAVPYNVVSPCSRIY